MSKTLTFLCSGDNGIGTININLMKINNPNDIDLQYRRNDQEGWQPYLFKDGKGETIALENGGSVSFSGNNKQFSKDLTNYYSFITKKSIENDNLGLFLSGDILALTNKESVTCSYEFFSLFKDCEDIVNAELLTLSSDKLRDYCYAYMFTNCTALTATPALQAEKLAKACYLSMFEGCTSLTITPLLPSQKLADKCYEQMFEGCTGLTSAYLPASSLVSGCYRQMFYGCSELAHVSAGFVNWKPYHATQMWLMNVPTLGEFTCLSTVDTTVRNNPSAGITDRIPQEWIVNQLTGVDYSAIYDSINTVISITQTYWPGDGLILSNVDGDQTFSVDTNWLSGTIGDLIVAYISDADISLNQKEYKAGTGLQLVNDDTFVLTGTVLSGGTNIEIENNKINCTIDVSNITVINELDDRIQNIENNYYSSAEVNNKFDSTSTYINSTSTTLNNILTGKINTASTTLTSQTNYLSGQIDIIKNDYTTSAYVTGIVNNLTTGAVATNTFNISELSGKFDNLDIPTDLGDLTNDAGYLKAVDLPPGTVYSTGVGLAASGENKNIFYLTGTVLSGGTDIEILNNKINFNGTIPTKVSDLDNDEGFLTADSFLKEADYVKAIPFADVENGYLEIKENMTSNEVMIAKNAIGVVDAEVTTGAQLIEKYGAKFARYLKLRFATKDNEGNVTDSNLIYIDVTELFRGFKAGTGIDITDNTINLDASISDLTNDSEFATSAQVSGIVKNMSATIINGLATDGDIPTTVAELADASNYALTSQLPTDYTTSAQVSSIVTGYGYITGIENNALLSDVQTASGNAVTTATGWVNGKNYLTAHQTFTGSDGIKVENNVISITGQVGKTYTGTEGIKVDNNTNQISLSATLPTKISELTNDIGYTTYGEIENKQKVVVVNGDTITFDTRYHVYKTRYAGGEVTLNDVIFDQYTIEPNEVTTFEQWITFDQPVTTVIEGNNILVGALPGSLDNTKTHVFIRRIFNDGGTIKQCISYAYYF